MAQDRSAPNRPLPLSAALGVTALGVAAMIVGGTLAARAGLSVRPQVAVGTVLLALPSILVLTASRATFASAVGPARVITHPVLLSLVLGGALWVASVGLIELQSLVMPPAPEYLRLFRAIHDALTPSGPLDALVSLAVIAVLPGLCEELVVRGLLLPALAARVAAPIAVAASALLFAAIHGDRYRFLFAFTLGVVLGVLRLRTDSLWPPIVAHATVNALTFALAPYLDDPSKAYTPQPLLGFACFGIGSAVALLVFGRIPGHPAARAA